MSKVVARAPFGDNNMPPPDKGLEIREQVAGAITLILEIIADRLSWFDRQRLARLRD